MQTILSAPISQPKAAIHAAPEPENLVTDTELQPVEPFVVPDFFSPIDFANAIYSPQFFVNFHRDNADTLGHVMGMRIVNQMEPHQRARLPLFAGACATYKESVSKEIQSMLTMVSSEKEILITKRQIVLCASNQGYLTDQNIFGTKPLNFDRVDLSGMNLNGLNLTEASVEGTNFDYPAKAKSEILKAPVYGFSDPELYVPVDPDNQIFSKEFYCLFRHGNEKNVDQQMGIITLQQMSVYQTAQLPIYAGACIKYLEIVMDATQRVFHSPETDDETMLIKQQIKLSVHTHWCATLLKLIDPDKGIYSNNLYSLFHTNATKFWRELGAILLESLNVQELARLPLFNDASNQYHAVVSNAIKEVLSSRETDHETLTTKRQIIANTRRYACITIPALFGDQLNLDSVNFSGLNLAGLDLSQASLKFANFRNVDLTCVQLPRMGSFHAFFQGAILNRKNLIDMTTPGQYLDLSGADLSRQSLGELNLKGIILRGVNLAGSYFHNTNLQDVDMEGADLTNASLTSTDLRGTRLAEAKLRGARFDSANFEGNDYSGIDFTDTELNNVNFSRAQLRRANFERAILKFVNFKGTDLTESNLFNVTFKSSEVENAVLTGVQTNNADLIQTIKNEDTRLYAVQARETYHREELHPIQMARSLPSLPSAIRRPVPVRNANVIEQNIQPPASGTFSWFSRFSSMVGNFFSSLLVRFKNFFGL